jgi:hypothetical protein
MSYVTVGTENSADIRIYYEDHGSVQPVVLIHGYPLNGHCWERQQRVLLHLDLTGVVKDRYNYPQGFLDNFYNTDRLCRHLANRLPGRPAQDRRTGPGGARHRGPDPDVPGHRGPAARADQRRQAGRRRRRAAQHRLDPPG